MSVWQPRQQFPAALPTHSVAACAASAKVQGLKGKKYLDKSSDPSHPTEKTEDRDAVTFGEGLVDSVYQDAPERVVLEVGTGELPSLPWISLFLSRRMKHTWLTSVSCSSAASPIIAQ
jgi:hypothetical protein